MWTQKEIIIKNKSRGFHLITDEIIKKLPELQKINIGILHIFINHTSASLAINENTDSSVRTDLESHFNRMVPEKKEFYTHTFEGEDDMPAHLKAAILGNVVTRLSGGAIGIIMIGAIMIAHSDWGIFTGERGAVLFASEQLFLLLLGVYFAIRGND